MPAPAATTALPESFHIKPNIAFGKACVQRDRNFHGIIEDEARSAGLARDLDSPTAWVWLRG
ncbi:MAG: hypothetical protein HZC54_21005 [Verrucomicrobia bacterium]|nr:hypothetical protein [Verrucomicrobiota bacterium]